MKKVLVAGATGYLGRYVVKEFKNQGFFVRALARNRAKLEDISDQIDEIVEAEITKPETLKGCCKDMDIVFSSVGITRQQDGLSYYDVDYQGNKNLLEEALDNGVRKFMYISVLNADKMADLSIINAKLKFVHELESSGIDYTVINPSGFFSDIEQYYEMAKFGVAAIVGNGNVRINPIHGEDLAKYCLSKLESPNASFNVGGPEILTHRQILEQAFKTIGNSPTILTIPQWIGDVSTSVIKTFLPDNISTPFQFALAALTLEMVGEQTGSHTLAGFFKDLHEKES
jgi:uncharacterized protein YbjT (DUF2867 family)